MDNNDIVHKPVMLKEVIRSFNFDKKGIFVDCTFGNGGHSVELLKKINKDSELISFELDKETVKNFHDQRFANFANFTLINDNFANVEERLNELGIEKVSGFLFDLGISSFQLEKEGRGFSYREDVFLDMRIDENQKESAFHVINHYEEKKLSDIFYKYGEERRSRCIAKKIVKRREREKIKTTQQLVGIITSCFSKKGKKHPAKRIFQSLRIYVNKELENLETALQKSFNLLDVEGVVIVISFHSLEDRIVKHFFKKMKETGKYEIIYKKPIIPGEEEIKENNRARSAKMRIIKRIKDKNNGRTKKQSNNYFN